MPKSGGREGCILPPWMRLLGPKCFNPSCFTSKVKRRLVFSYINSLNPSNTSAFRPMCLFVRTSVCSSLMHQGECLYTVHWYMVHMSVVKNLPDIDRLFLTFLAHLSLSMFLFFYCVRIIPHPEKQLRGEGIILRRSVRWCAYLFF